MFTKSIRWRLQLWLAFLLVCVLTGFGVAVFQLHRLNQFNQIDEELEKRVVGLSAALRGRPPFGPGKPPFDHGDRGPGHFGPGERSGDRSEHRPPPDGPPPDFMRRGGPPDMHGNQREFKLPPELAGSFDETQTNGFYFMVWSRSGTLLKTSTNAPPGVLMPNRRSGTTLSYTRTRDSFREVFHFTEMGDCVLAGHSVISDLKDLQTFTFWLIAAGGGVLALGCGGGWWLATTAIRPVEEISAAASRISAGNLSERIQEPDPDNELGRLAGVLNSTFARLESSFAQQKQFTADASHELRTPLAVLISEAQTTLARERTAPEYRETIEACLETAQQMRRLTESLLELARVEAGDQAVDRGPVDLADVAKICLERMRPLAAQSDLQVLSQFDPAMTTANAERLDQVVTNLISNAIYYNKPGGRVEVTTRTDDGKAVLMVTDSGQGISPEDLPHIFERFYRADKSRSRAAGHSGLGLSICKTILDAEGGRIEVSSELGIGTTFKISTASI